MDVDMSDRESEIEYQKPRGASGPSSEPYTDVDRGLAITELLRIGRLSDNKGERQRRDNLLRQKYGLPTSFPNASVEEFAQKFIPQILKSSLGLPNWAASDQVAFVEQNRKRQAYRKDLKMDPDTPDEIVDLKLVKNATEELLAEDRKYLNLAADASPSIILRAALKTKNADVRDFVGLPPGTPLNPQALLRADMNCERLADIALARKQLKLPPGFSDSTVEKLDKSWRDFEEKYNVQVVHMSASHKVIFSHSPNAFAAVKIGEFDVPKDQLASAEKIALGWIDKTENNLTKEFGLKFTQPGQELTDRVRHEDSSDPNAKTRSLPQFSTLPTVTELLGLESALWRINSHDAHPLPSGLEVTFLNHSDGEANAFYIAGKNRIYFESDCATKSATQAELLNGGSYPGIPDSMEGTATHELAHSIQDKQGWFKEGEFATTKRKNLKWVGLKIGSEKTPDWFLSGKDGHLYRLNVESNHWIRFDSNRRMLGANNLPVTELSKAAYFTNEQMAAEAQEKPATHYFSRPQEMDAEAMMMFRLGGFYRKELLRTNAELYNIVKEEDQSYINTLYGAEPHGKANYVRTPEGAIVKNTPNIQAKLNYFEKKTQR
jgi:hypothetical protein